MTIIIWTFHVQFILQYIHFHLFLSWCPTFWMNQITDLDRSMIHWSGIIYVYNSPRINLYCMYLPHMWPTYIFIMQREKPSKRNVYWTWVYFSWLCISRCKTIHYFLVLRFLRKAVVRKSCVSFLTSML